MVSPSNPCPCQCKSTKLQKSERGKYYFKNDKGKIVYCRQYGGVITKNCQKKCSKKESRKTNSPLARQPKKINKKLINKIEKNLIKRFKKDNKKRNAYM